MRAQAVVLALVVTGALAAAGEEARFAVTPAVTRDGDKVKIAFAVAAPADVEVAVLGADGKVVRHLAAGVLGGKNPPPEPLKAGLSQALEWDGKDDFGKPATGGPFHARVRAGSRFKFGRFIGEDPCNLGAIDSIATDEEGNVHVMGFGGEANQGHMVLRVFDPDGRYLREILPFPASLPPEAMKDIARWDEERKAFFPQQLKNLNPDFYDGARHGSLHLVSASARSGVLLTDGVRLCKLDSRGAVPEARFACLSLWPPKGVLPNTGGGPTCLKASPDGKYLYLSGPYSSKTAYGHVADPRFPPGQVYRMEVGSGTMQPFVKLPTVGENPAKAGYGWCSKHISHPSHYTVPHGPIHDVAADRDGNLFVADQDNQCVVVFDSSGKEAGRAGVPYPDILAVHPRTGALYVLTKEIKGYHQFRKTLVKFSGWKDPKQVALLDLGADAGSMPQMALSAGEKKTVLWLSGLRGGLIAVEDTGTALEEKKTLFAPRPDVPADWNRLAVDPARNEVYVSNGTTRLWRYDGQTGQGGILKKDGRDFLANDLAVGYDGNLYVRVSGDWDHSAASYSGPFWRLDRDLNPIPFAATGTHVLSPYVYSRYGIGFAERGIGVGPDGTSYVSFMYKWVAYAIAGFGPDGKPLPGKYLKGAFPTEKPEDKKKYPAGLDGAVIGPVAQANAGIRVDLAGNIYVGMLHWPKGVPLPDGFKMDRAWADTVGSVLKFRPDQGGAMAGDEGSQRAEAVTGVVTAYPGLAPFSKAGLGGNTCCVCRGPSFDLDRYGRLALPNAVTCSVWLYDNAGNLIAELGKYGNFDSQFVNPNTREGSQGKPTVAVPDIPLAWPTGAGLSDEHVYVLDTCTRRVLRVDKAWSAEATVDVK
jgi:DNA-binding beta-propeller fold protein YncE